MESGESRGRGVESRSSSRPRVKITMTHFSGARTPLLDPVSFNDPRRLVAYAGVGGPEARVAETASWLSRRFE